MVTYLHHSNILYFHVFEVTPRLREWGSIKDTIVELQSQNQADFCSVRFIVIL